MKTCELSHTQDCADKSRKWVAINIVGSHTVSVQFSSVLFHILYHKGDSNECLQVDWDEYINR